MPTVTIPKNLIKNDDLIVIPRKEYEALLRAKKSEPPSDIIVKRTMRVPKRLEKFYDKVDRELSESLRDYYAGKYHGPFQTVEEGIKFLNAYKASRAKNEVSLLAPLHRPTCYFSNTNSEEILETT